MDHVGKDNGKIITAYEIALPTTHRQIRKMLMIAIRVVSLQAFEKKRKELFVFEARCEVFNSGVI